MSRLSPFLLSSLGLGLVALALTADAETAPAAARPDAATPASAGAASSAPGLRISLGLDRAVLAADAAEERYLVLDLDGEAGAARGDLPLHLVLALDVSGSMAGEGKLQAAVAAAEELVAGLRPADGLTLVSFGSEARVLLDLPAGGQDLDVDAASRVLHELRPAGGTAMHAALQLAAASATDRPRGIVPRVVVLSDGIANVGPSRVEDLAQVAAGSADRGAAVTTIGLGLDFDEVVLASIADAGGGRTDHAIHGQDLDAAFLDELHQLRRLSARQVQAELRPAPGVELLDVYGYEAWDGHPTADGYAVRVGDLVAGHPRKVVARVRIQPGVTDLGEVALSWWDPAGATQHSARRAVSASRSSDPAALAAAVDAARSQQAARAVAGAGMVATRQAWRDHSAIEAEKQREQTLRQLQALSAVAGDDNVAFAQERLNRQVDGYLSLDPDEAAGNVAGKAVMLEALGYVE